MSVWLQKSASIQQRTSPPKFAGLSGGARGEPNSRYSGAVDKYWVLGKVTVELALAGMPLVVVGEAADEVIIVANGSVAGYVCSIFSNLTFLNFFFVTFRKPFSEKFNYNSCEI